MSVIKSKRKTSVVEYVYNARLLAKYTISRCINFSKRYTFYVSTDLSDTAKAIYDKVIRANAIYPNNQHDLQMRRDLLIGAKLDLYSLISKIELAYEILDFKESSMIYWLGLVDKELRLVKGVIEKDKERFNSLKE